MKMTKQLMLAAAMLLLSLTVLYAQGPGSRKMPNVKVTGTGVLTAQGDGMARVMSMQGTVEITGNGQLIVNKNAKVEITGEQGTKEEKTNPNNAQMTMVVYKGFNGKAVITGEKFMVAIHGKGITLTAKGAGQAMLMGKGNYTVVKDGEDAKAQGEWTARPEGKGKQGGNAANAEEKPAADGKPGEHARRMMRDGIMYGTWEVEGRGDGNRQHNRKAK